MAFLTLTVAEIFDDRFQPLVPTLIGLTVGSLVLGVFLFISEYCWFYLVDGVFKGFKRLWYGQQKADKDR